MLPDFAVISALFITLVVSQCTYRCVVLPDTKSVVDAGGPLASQCTYRCVVLPDAVLTVLVEVYMVSMHLQVRGAP